ncbi:hypothetical protein GCM10020331_061150 [Ectobacillus funiculus]
MTRKDIYKANAWFAKIWGMDCVFCRLIPLVRSLISIPAGMSRMNFVVFLLLTTLGTLIWNVILVNLGAAVGGSWESIVGYMDIYSNIIYVGLGILFFLLFVVMAIRKKESSGDEISKAMGESL